MVVTQLDCDWNVTVNNKIRKLLSFRYVCVCVCECLFTQPALTYDCEWTCMSTVQVCARVRARLRAGFTGPGFDIHATPPTHWGPISRSFTYLWKTDWKERERRGAKGRVGRREIDGEEERAMEWVRKGRKKRGRPSPKITIPPI